MAIADTFEPGQGFMAKQVEGALRIQRERRVILADQPGAGKTLQAILACELDGLFDRRSNILILCNVTGCQLTWSPEIKKRIATQYDIVFADLTDTRGRKTMPSLQQRDDHLATSLIDADDTARPLIALANYEQLRWQIRKAPKVPTLWEIEWDAVIIDEAHLVLPTTVDKEEKLTQFWYGLGGLQYRNRLCGLCGEPHHPTDHDEDDFPGRRFSYREYTPIQLPISGTPDRGKLENRYGYWKWFWPTSHTDFLSWASGQFVITWEEVGWDRQRNRPTKVPVIGKLRHPDQWAFYDRQHVIRRTKQEMWVGMPEKIWPEGGGVDIPLTPTQQQAYDDYLDELEAKEQELIELGDEQAASALRLRFALRGRQMATATWDWVTTIGDDGREHETGTPKLLGRDGSSKLAWLLDWMEARGYTAENWDPTQGKVVIVSFFTEVLKWLQLELRSEGIESEILAGDTPLMEKQRIEGAFQRGGLRVVLLQGYLGVSINLDAADDMIFMDLVHDPDRIEQAEDRIHRASRMHHAFYWRLVAVGTIDQATVELVDARYKTTRASYDGSRGIEFARRMLGATPRGAR